MFLCRLNPSCPFSCSTVDPPWHFSAGAHEASCHWQTGTLQLKYPEETRDQRWLFSSPPSSVLVSTSLFFFNTSPFKVTGCSVVFSTQNILYILYTQSYWQRAWITTILFTTFISTGVTSEWSIVLDCKLTMYHWQHHPCVIVKLISIGHSNIASDEIIFSICDFCECSDGDSVRPVVHHWSLINSITGSATGLTNLFCHNKAD